MNIFNTVGECGEAGACSTSCKYPHLKLLKCAKCKKPHHHVCDGETDDLSVCAKCSGKHGKLEPQSTNIKVNKQQKHQIHISTSMYTQHRPAHNGTDSKSGG